MDIKIGSNYLLDPEFILNRARIAEGNRVADLGCGSSGHFVFPASQKVGGKGRVFAVDILKKTLEVIKKRAEQENINNIETVWSDLEVYKGADIESESLDVALLINTLFQSSNKPAILREVARLLKKNGRLLVVEWEMSDLPIGPPAESRVKKNHLIEIAKKTGLKNENEFKAGKHHYGILFTKM